MMYIASTQLQDKAIVRPIIVNVLGRIYLHDLLAGSLLFLVSSIIIEVQFS